MAAVGCPAVALVWLTVRAPEVIDGKVITERVRWVPELGIDFDLRLDGFGLLMAFLVAGIGVLVLAYGAATSRRVATASDASSVCSRSSPGRCSAWCGPTT